MVVAVLALASVAYAGNRLPFGMPAYSHQGITIQPKEIYFDGGKLTVRVIVINETGKSLSLDKAQIQLRVGDSILPRDEGVFGKFAKPALVAPGLSHPLYIDFRLAAPGPVKLVLAHGFIVDGQSLPLPDLPIAPLGG